VVVSNHCHVAVLAENETAAKAYGVEVKRMFSMWCRKKYGQANTLGNTGLTVLSLDNDRYVRNALAYIPRNALDNGCNVNEYKWSGFRAMFLGEEIRNRIKGIKVSSLRKREREMWLHTGDKLKDCPWLLDDQKELIPFSFCDYPYLEQAFHHDQAFFLRIIGTTNAADIAFHMDKGGRKTDEEMMEIIEEKSLQRFRLPVSALTMSQKMQLVQILSRSQRTSIPQLARISGLRREWVRLAVQKPPRQQQ